MEFQNHQNETSTAKMEATPKRFPVVNVEGSYYYDDRPPHQEGTIVHYFEGDVHSTEKSNRYLLLKNVAGFNYIFRLGETRTSGTYGLGFKTEEYEHATVNLDDEGHQELAQTITAFIESVYTDTQQNMHEIHISPSDATYSAGDIENCMEEILRSPDNTLNRAELMSKYNGYDIFRLYLELFDKIYEGENDAKRSRASGRARFFKMMFRKNLPNWDIQDSYGLTNDFDLIRK
ncbi:MAG: hypothetical protein WC791_00885 [Candidatus Paceibacterota bacterium]